MTSENKCFRTTFEVKTNIHGTDCSTHTYTHSVHYETRHQPKNVMATMTQILWCNPESMNMTFHLILQCFFLTWHWYSLCTCDNTAIRTGQSQNSLTLLLVSSQRQKMEILPLSHLTGLLIRYQMFWNSKLLSLFRRAVVSNTTLWDIFA